MTEEFQIENIIFGQNLWKLAIVGLLAETMTEPWPIDKRNNVWPVVAETIVARAAVARPISAGRSGHVSLIREPQSLLHFAIRFCCIEGYHEPTPVTPVTGIAHIYLYNSKEIYTSHKYH